ncbi:amidohydrolase family protein [Rehaibacterium terrae]|jgi:imidazolonepropionase-like amidohydrolase|uniref:Imidazolonepropionase-like amidohydrolase n=1 Tax=Rehaibacterium terrae TaxID=1341696 RepID=A0A7W7XZI2_9GAMM|nr:amidohydrolase family protein [Rehaibacterium terrae]MBB5015305.1 imidazolonepropionase-like amidohydrolase [Rehaibacterium terrae]
MKRLLAALLCLLPGLAAAEAIVFRNVNVVPMDRETVLPRQTVVVRDGRIAALGPAAEVAIPDGARVVEAEGKYLMPGLGEAHGHMPPRGHANLDTVLDLFLAHGITTVRGVLGEPGQLTLRAELAAGERAGPRLYTAAPSLNGNSVRDPAHAAELVETYHRNGYDLLKIHPGLDVPRFDAILDKARALDMIVVGHVPEAVGLAHALAQRMSCIEHLDDYVRALVPDGHPARTATPGFFGLLQAEVADEARIPVLVEKTRAAGAWMSPTETLMVSMLGPDSTEALLAREEFAYVPAATRKQWAQARENLRNAPGFTAERAARFLELRRLLLKALHDGGVGILLGSDAPQWFNVPGYSAHRELALMVEAGLTPYQALRTGTVNIATHLRAGDRRGTIAAGMDADLVLLDANPLEDIAHTLRIAGVMVAGRWHDRADLDARLDAIRRAAAE